MAEINLFGSEYTWKIGFSSREISIKLSTMLNRAFSLMPDKKQFGVELSLVRDGSMIAYNKTAMHCVGPTNILSFPIPDSSLSLCKSGTTEFASLVLSVDAVCREAKLFRQTIQKHTLHLLAHGVGHLMGFEHCPKMFIFCDNIAKNL